MAWPWCPKLLWGNTQFLICHLWPAAHSPVEWVLDDFKCFTKLSTEKNNANSATICHLFRLNVVPCLCNRCNLCKLCLVIICYEQQTCPDGSSSQLSWEISQQCHMPVAGLTCYFYSVGHNNSSQARPETRGAAAGLTTTSLKLIRTWTWTKSNKIYFEQ